MGIEITRDTLASGEVLAFIRRETRAFPAAGHTVLSDDEIARSLDRTLSDWDGRSDVWLFGYGSLIWNPAMRFAERQVALLTGWQRRFCLWLRIGRGSIEHPGLMLALDRGGHCRGVVFRIPAAEVRTELPLVWVREMATGSYAAHWVPVETAGGTLHALTFTADHGHPRYAGPVTEDQAASCIAVAAGQLGSCADYLLSTADHLESLGLRDGYIEGLAARVREILGRPDERHAADPTLPKI
ncbi:MAG TPA: gamma-glutamylcyclotransferase [Arenibaculum sp.]|nr:gamma-glutamylcyclotransferase [Arenibaculum sp.]